jgi:hypothetical protein
MWLSATESYPTRTPCHLSLPTRRRRRRRVRPEPTTTRVSLAVGPATPPRPAKRQPQPAVNAVASAVDPPPRRHTALLGLLGLPLKLRPLVRSLLPAAPHPQCHSLTPHPRPPPDTSPPPHCCATSVTHLAPARPACAWRAGPPRFLVASGCGGTDGFLDRGLPARLPMALCSRPLSS